MWGMSTAFTIRMEEPQERVAVRAVNVAAFGGDAEADLVQRLQDDGDTLFGLVAVWDGQIAGHLVFSQLPIEMAQETVSAAALAPLAVLPELQRQGIGSALVRHGLTQCQNLGLAAVVVLGDPAYYGRFGFRVDLAERLRTPWSGPHLMAYEIVPGALGDGLGTAIYPAAFGALPPDS